MNKETKDLLARICKDVKPITEEEIDQWGMRKSFDNWRSLPAWFRKFHDIINGWYGTVGMRMCIILVPILMIIFSATHYWGIVLVAGCFIGTMMAVDSQGITKDNIYRILFKHIAVAGLCIFMLHFLMVLLVCPTFVWLFC